MARTRLKVALSGGRGGNVHPYYPSDPEFLSDVRQQTRAITDSLISIMEQFEDVSEDIMINALRPTFEKSQDVYVPVDTGELRASGYLEKVGTKKKPMVEIGYGRFKKPYYTIWVHEINAPHRAPQQWKFLQQAVMEDLDVIYQRLGQGYKVFMGAMG